MRTRFDRFFLWLPVVLIDVGIRLVGAAAFKVWLVLARHGWRGSRVLFPGEFETFMNRYSSGGLLVAAVTAREIAETACLSVHEVYDMINVLVEHRWVRRVAGPGMTAYVLGTLGDEALRKSHAEFRAVRLAFKQATGMDVTSADAEMIERRLLPHIRIGFLVIDHVIRLIRTRSFALMLVLLRGIWRRGARTARTRKGRNWGQMYDQGRLATHAGQASIGESAGSCREIACGYLSTMEQLGWFRVVPGRYEHTYIVGERIPAEPGSDRRWASAERIYVVDWMEAELRKIAELREIVDAVDHPPQEQKAAPPDLRRSSPPPPHGDAQPEERARPHATPAKRTASDGGKNGPTAPDAPARRPIVAPPSTGSPAAPTAASVEADIEALGAVEKWEAAAFIAYFGLMHRRTWPSEGWTDVGEDADRLVEEALNWLAAEGQGPALLGRVIDLTFARWAQVSRWVEWRGQRPDLRVLGVPQPLAYLARTVMGLETCVKREQGKWVIAEDLSAVVDRSRPQVPRVAGGDSC